jgi:acetyl esterase
MVDKRGFQAAAEKAVARTLFRLPRAAKRVIAGKPIRLDGQTLDLDIQLMLKLSNMQGIRMGAGGEPIQRRVQLEQSGELLPPTEIDPVDTRGLTVADTMPARLYTPQGLPDGSPLLVYLHGGGWVIGSLETHDELCRYLAVHAGVRVLSVDYRLAPEHPFPAAPQDSLAAYLWAREHAPELGADQDSVALGGDSAGGNLSAVVAHQCTLSGDRVPDFLLLFYPSANPSAETGSRKLFDEGFFLTDADMTWFADHYCPADQRGDVRYAPLLADDLSGLPPTYVATGGFDPLRDDGEAFAKRLTESGVPVVLRRHPELIHGFANMSGLSAPAAAAVAEAAGALRTGLSLARAKTARSSR